MNNGRQRTEQDRAQNKTGNRTRQRTEQDRA